MDADSAIVGTDVTVVSVAPRPCASTSCPGEPFGTALGAYYGARIELTGFLLSDADLCGLQVAAAAGVDLRSGIVSGCEIGACVQIDGYDLDRLTDGVAYFDNAVDLQSTTLPIPEPN